MDGFGFCGYFGDDNDEIDKYENDYDFENYSDYGNTTNIGSSYSLINIEEDDNKKKGTPLTKEDEKKLMEESIGGKITGKMEFGKTFRLIGMTKEEANTLEFTGDLTEMEIDEEDESITFDLGSVNPYDERRLFCRKSVIIKPNEINCLIGCNGAGKSTIVSIIKDIIKDNGYPLVLYNNMKDGGDNIYCKDGFSDNFAAIFAVRELSEGEQILNASSRYLELLNSVLDGNIKRDDNFRIYRDTQHVFLLLDAIDSGYSIDNIFNLVFNLRQAIKKAKMEDKYLYIIAAANSYELVRHNRCWDVQKSKEVTFKDYEEYRKRIIETRQHILKQWEKKEEKE